jgi:hypothetical protein
MFLLRFNIAKLSTLEKRRLHGIIRACLTEALCSGKGLFESSMHMWSIKMLPKIEKKATHPYLSHGSGMQTAKLLNLTIGEPGINPCDSCLPYRQEGATV